MVTCCDLCRDRSTCPYHGPFLCPYSYYCCSHYDPSCDHVRSDCVYWTYFQYCQHAPWVVVIRCREVAVETRFCVYEVNRFVKIEGNVLLTEEDVFDPIRDRLCGLLGYN